MTTYFITGATGAVGSALCEHLLTLPDTRLLLLARADDDLHLQKRGETLAKYWGMTTDMAARVEWLRGDTTAASFGLAAADWHAAAAKTTHVIHCAGAVRMNLPIEKARASAVFAAENVIAFARDVSRLGQLKKIELVSTVGVSGRQPGLLTETWQGTNRAYHNTYEQAKAEAEVVMQQAIEAGLPATVHRPSMVVGEAATGKIIHFQIFYHLAEFLSGVRTRGLFPDTGITQLDLVPSDYVARAIIWSSQTPATIGQILHLCSGPDSALPLSAVRTIVQQRFRAAGLPVTRGLTVPAAMFRAAARALAVVASPKHRRALEALPVFLDYLTEAQSFANVQTARTLNAVGIAAPAMQAFVGPVLDYYLARRAMRTAVED